MVVSPGWQLPRDSLVNHSTHGSSAWQAVSVRQHSDYSAPSQIAPHACGPILTPGTWAERFLQQQCCV